MRYVVMTSDHGFWLLVGWNCYTVREEVFR